MMLINAINAVGKIIKFTRDKFIILGYWYRYITFNPKEYWTKRGGGKYLKQFQPEDERNTKLILNTLNSLEFESLIDIGCGYGRYLKSMKENLYNKNNVKLVGVDISPTQILAAKDFCQKVHDVEFIEIDGKHFPFEDKSFDIAFTYGCMGHVPYKEINSFFSEVCRLTKKYGLFLELSDKRTSSRPIYYFCHDYKTIFEKFGLKYEIIRRFDYNPNEYLFLVYF